MILGHCDGPLRSRAESRCCITGVGQWTHVIASHIRLLRDFSNEERLNDESGLLLTLSIDHMFTYSGPCRSRFRADGDHLATNQWGRSPGLLPITLPVSWLDRLAARLPDTSPFTGNSHPPATAPRIRPLVGPMTRRRAPGEGWGWVRLADAPRGD